MHATGNFVCSDFHVLQDQVFLEHLVAMFFGLVASPKAVNCASAASMLKLFLHKVCSNFNIHLQAITKKVCRGMLAKAVLIRVCNIFTTVQRVKCSEQLWLYGLSQSDKSANPIMTVRF